MRKQGLRPIPLDAADFVDWVESVGLARVLTEMGDFCRAFAVDPRDVSVVTVYVTPRGRQPRGAEFTCYVNNEDGTRKRTFFDAEGEEQESPLNAASMTIEYLTTEHDWPEGLTLPSWWETVSNHKRPGAAVSG